MTMITTTKMHKDGKLVEIEPTDYVLKDGVKVYRRSYKKYPVSTVTGVFSFIPVYDLLNEISETRTYCRFRENIVQDVLMCSV